MPKPKRLTWDDLKRREVAVTIPLPDGTSGEVVLCTISEDEQERVRASVKWPVAPMDVVRDKRTGQIRRVANTEDPKYQEQMRAANREFIYRLLLRSLVDPVPPGETEEEQVQALQENLGFWAFKALLDEVMRINGITEAEVATARENFLTTIF